MLVGISISALLLLFMDDVLGIIGASSDSWDFTKNDLSIVAIAGPFLLVSNSFSNIIRAEGQASKAIFGVMLGNIINIVLDPILILVFDWGITGAAIATAIGNVLGGLYYILYFLRGSSILSISIKDFAVKDRVLRSVLAIGVPASLGTLIMSFSQIIMNGLMSQYSDMAVAAVGVAMKITMIIATVSIGLGQGAQPLLGYCVGAGNWDRFKSIMRFSVMIALVGGVVLTGLCFAFAESIVKVFLTEPDALAYGTKFTRILLSTTFLFGLFYCMVNALQSMGAAVSSLIVNISRQGLIYIPALFIFKSLLDAQGLVWAQPLADVTSLVLAVFLFLLSYRKMKNLQPDLPNSTASIVVERTVT